MIRFTQPLAVPSQEDVVLHDGHEGAHLAADPLRHLLNRIHSMVPLLQVGQLFFWSLRNFKYPKQIYKQIRMRIQCKYP